MKVLYDYQIFEINPNSGVARYYYELIKNLRRESLVDTILSITKTNCIYLRNDLLLKNNIDKFYNFNNFLSGKDFKGKRRLYNLLIKLGFLHDDSKINKANSEKLLNSENFDVFHPTYYDDYFLEFLDKKPFVLTIYDMTHEIFPEYFPLRNYEIKNKKILAKKASKIIAISNSTKKDIINFLNIEEDKIVVIYLGCSLVTNDKRYCDLNINTYFNLVPQKYLLYVGSRNGYKNFYYFVRAISQILKKDKDLYIICAGGGKFNRDEKFYFESLDLQDSLINFEICDDNLLKYLYSKAAAFVFPSLYEGFGLPILEAFSCGCPVVLSNKSSLPEVGGDAAIYFEPKNIKSIIGAVTDVIYNDNLRKELIKKGFEKLKKFSWEKTAIQTRNVYESIC